jgi:AcrR family transcriptional regulator
LSTEKPSQRKRPPREETRERVLDAALALFYELGPTAATVDAIAARAGLTKGAVYSSFATKDELFAATVERLPTTMYTDVLRDASNRGEVRRALAGFGRAVANMQPPDPATALIHELYAVALRNPNARETIATWVASLIEEAAAAVPAQLDGRMKVSYRDMWVVGQALLEGLFVRRATNPELVSDQLIIAAMELLAGFVDDGDDATT